MTGTRNMTFKIPHFRFEHMAIIEDGFNDDEWHSQNYNDILIATSRIAMFTPDQFVREKSDEG